VGASAVEDGLNCFCLGYGSDCCMLTVWLLFSLFVCCCETRIIELFAKRGIKLCICEN
jgi:hypothetical protein